MAYINITASEFNVVKQNIQEKYTKIELLDSNLQIVDSLEGVTLNGSITIDADSDMRRNATLKFAITDSSFEIESGSKIWMDKYIRLYLGIYSIQENDIIYTNVGTFVVDAPSYEYDATNNSVKINLLDLMSKLSGIRNGYLEGVPVMIPAGTNIREVIISTLELGGFTKYVCEEAPAPGVVPMDLTFNQGTTVYNMLSQLKDIYPNYEIYFDVDGVFHYNKIPNGINEPVQIDDSLWHNILIGENLSVDYQNVKNYIEVYGRTHNPQYFSTATTVENNNITLTIQDAHEYEDGIIYGFTLTNNTGIHEPQLKIYNGEYRYILSDSGERIDILAETGEVYYCVQYVENLGGTPYWRWLGHLQAYALAKDDNPDSPFYIGGNLGLIRLPLFGGDYENCITDDLAQQRANYELYLHSQLPNTVTFLKEPSSFKVAASQTTLHL